MTREQDKARSIERKQAREFTTAVSSYAYQQETERESKEASKSFVRAFYRAKESR